MNRMRMTVVGMFASLALAGCGSSSDVEIIANNNPQPLPVLSGQVLAESGTALTGVRLVAQERTTRQEVETVSGADGSFRMTVPAGVYDVGLDLEGDLNTATSFYGPVIVGSSLETDFVLQDSEGRGADEVFGRIFLQPGVPAVGRQVSLVAGAVIGGLPVAQPPAVTAATNADGTFDLTLSLSQEVAIDVEVYDANGILDEFIDIGKRDKPCYVEFSVEQSAVENLLRSNQSEIAPATLAQVRAQLQPVESDPFNAAFDPATTILTLSGGQLPVGGQGTIRELSITFPTDPDPGNQAVLDNLANWTVLIEANGSWWWKYGANILVNLPATWRFTDNTNDTYHLWAEVSDVVDGVWLKVSYNSSNPTIKNIVIEN